MASEHRLAGYVKETQSCHGAKAAGVRIGTNRGKEKGEEHQAVWGLLGSVQ